MTNKSTFSILFVAQKGKLKANGKAPILARVTVNGEMVHLATRVDVDPDRWLGKECRTPGRSAEDKYINEMLDNYRNVIKNKYNELFFRGEAITAMRLKSILTSRSDEAKRLLVLFDEFNEDYRALVGKETTHKTYTRYLLTRRRLAEFMAAKYKIRDILLSDINTKFINDFYIYLRTVDGKNGHNYHMKMIQRLRTVFKTAKDNGWVTADPFGGFKISMEETHREHLTIDELGVLVSKEMTSERLQRVKDIFVFSCFTGLAYTDVRGLKKSEVVMGNDGRLWIDTRRDKTKVAVYVPLLDIPRAILEKYADQTSHDRLLSIPANQKVNDYLKEIAAICGIDKNLTFHIARHTFATTVTLENGVALETVQKMLGHKNIRTTQVYAKMTKRRIGMEMESLAGVLDKGLQPAIE
ncbi:MULTISPECIES: site-specific integrase [Alistipes]|uniref:site-specific integrase n=1 Tax=Alistipes TaxID=239759 RepID=UPI001B36921E|nr:MULTISPECIES: site-specific integrase [Alistipes]MBQ4902307.1 site-specific integrase [Alistipes sp. Marseille-P2263]MCI2257581.1 site-specific integrase [Alistipes dispar]